jgi:hypothetical protein
MAASLGVSLCSGVELSAVGSQLVQLGICSEIGDRQRGHEDVNTKAEEATALEAVTRRQPVKIQQTVMP